MDPDPINRNRSGFDFKSNEDPDPYSRNDGGPDLTGKILWIRILK